MIPNGRPLQLEYRTTKPLTHGMRRRTNAMPARRIITLELSPHEISWDPVQQYQTRHSGQVGYSYSNPCGIRELPPTPTFRLMAVSPSEDLPPKLTRLLGKSITLGQVTTGRMLLLRHSYRQFTEEWTGDTDRTIHSQELTLPAVLLQAFLGKSRNYPLFDN